MSRERVPQHFWRKGQPMAVDERTLTARFKSWVDAELQATPYGSLTRAENEVHASGSHKRHDRDQADSSAPRSVSGSTSRPQPPGVASLERPGAMTGCPTGKRVSDDNENGVPNRVPDSAKLTRFSPTQPNWISR